ncbi:MAG TPA: cyclopropane-fatty-acyl-phospholipid synthase family protein [Solirubrobacterales bacterium]|jgi:cyclopropane-fatty-acyl-phospholipid synthase|nr:cyclopropane-fatty-acyl-phospholipid synthase family protein [Solirubrobacterales bacterium]
MTLTERACRRVALRVLPRLEGGHLELLEPGGARFSFGEVASDLRATITLHSQRFYRALLGGTVGLGEAYRDGVWDTNDPVSLVRIACRNLPSLDRVRRRFHPFLGPLQRTLWRVPHNTPRKAKRHISAHYDLGNDLFALFLDESMMYSSAYFPEPETTLAEAQRARLERVCTALELGPGDHLLEIGTGWGGLAVHAAANYGCRVTTTTISEEQREGALRRISDAGLGDRITVLLDDYRDLGGSYDKLVSLEMIEAVGWQYFDRFFRQCSRLLKPDGLMFLQAIVIDDRVYELEKASRTLANTLIFPGGCLPSVEVIQRCIARQTDMSAVWMDDISAHYVRTLELWRERFVANSDLAGELGYDEPFRRLWALWLAMSEAGFRERRIRDVQMLFAKPASRPSLRAGYGSVGAAASSI